MFKTRSAGTPKMFFISDYQNKLFLNSKYENAVRHCLKKIYDFKQLAEKVVESSEAKSFFM